MILLVDQSFKIVKTCQNDEEFCQYIAYLKNQENRKAALDPDYPAVKWEFSRYTHKCLSDFLENQEQKAFREMAENACEKQQDILMIHKGERANPLYICIDSELNAAQLRKDWCQAFAKDHGLIMITA